jgi:hypothetical protein
VRAVLCPLIGVGEKRRMQRATKLLLFDISAFYALGLALLLKTYWFDERYLFLFIMLFWTKMAMTMTAVGMVFWLRCILGNSFGHPVKAPVRFLARTYLTIGVLLLGLQVYRGEPSPSAFGDGAWHYYECDSAGDNAAAARCRSRRLAR